MKSSLKGQGLPPMGRAPPPPSLEGREDASLFFKARGHSRPLRALCPEVSEEAEAFVDAHGLGMEALRRENKKFLEAEVAKWNALTPEEKPFECQGKSAADIFAWRAAKEKRLARQRKEAALFWPSRQQCSTAYEEKLARWKRAILEEKIIDLDDAAFEEKFAEWDTHALRLEAMKQDIVRFEKKAVELKIEELREQAARRQAELRETAQK